MHGLVPPFSSTLPPPRRWPKGHALIGHGFKSAVELTSLLSIMLVAYTCHWTLQHSVRVWGAEVAGCNNTLSMPAEQRLLEVVHAHGWYCWYPLVALCTPAQPFTLHPSPCHRCRAQAP